MKKLVILLLIMPLLLTSQDLSEIFPVVDGKINYNEVVQVDSTLTAETLYMNAKKWAVDNFGSGKEVIQTDDRDLKILIMKGFFSKGHNAMVRTPRNWFTIKIEARDGRYRYELYDLRYTGIVSFMNQVQSFDHSFEDWVNTPSNQNLSERRKAKADALMADYLTQINAHHINTITSLKQAMQKKIISDW